MVEISIENSFDFTSPEYVALFGASTATAFQHPIWLDHLYRTLVPHQGRPLIITARSGPERRLSMVLPLVRRRYGLMRVIEFADLKVCDYAATICDNAAFTAILADASAGATIRRLLKPFDLLRIPKLKEGSLPLEQLLGAATRTAMDTNAYAVALGQPYPDWRGQNLNASYRKELDKKSRQLYRRGVVQFECCLDPADIRATFESLRDYRKLRFDDNGGGELMQIPTYFEFYRDVALHGRETLARTYRMTVDGRPVACVLGLEHQGQFLVILGGFDHAGYKNQSIGALMFEQVARDCIERGNSVLDFTIGDEPYKLTFGAQPSRMWMISRAGSPLGSAAGMAVEQLPWVKALAKRLFATPRAATNGAAGAKHPHGRSDLASDTTGIEAD